MGSAFVANQVKENAVESGLKFDLDFFVIFL